MVVDLIKLYPHLKQRERWDRQTVVIVCNSWVSVMKVREKIRGQRNPNSSHFIIAGIIESDSFVNLNYDPTCRRPQDRNVRIVYIDGSRVMADEIYSRFSDAYIIVENEAYNMMIERGEVIDTDAVSNMSIECRA